MGQSLRQIKRRIRSVENTAKLTSALEMISVSKLRLHQGRLATEEIYFARLKSMLERLCAGMSEPVAHPLFKTPTQAGKRLVIVIASDTGLCGNYNGDILRALSAFLTDQGDQPWDALAIGKRALNACVKLSMDVPYSIVNQNSRFARAVADEIADKIKQLFLSGPYGTIHAVVTRYATGSRHQVISERILPVEWPGISSQRYLVEPSTDVLLNALLEQYVRSHISFLLLHAFTCEHASRATAMGEASDNARELIEQLILTRNKVRQANITREIIEVISSTEALRG